MAGYERLKQGIEGFPACEQPRQEAAVAENVQKLFYCDTFPSSALRIRPYSNPKKKASCEKVAFFLKTCSLVNPEIFDNGRKTA